jgi:hypothetical protein
MDAPYFDALARSWGTRRDGLRALASATIADVISGLDHSVAGSKKKKRKKKKKTCKGETKKCGQKCIPVASCCRDAECGTGGACVDRACACFSGFRACKGACVADAACCLDADCGAGGSCQAGNCIVPTCTDGIKNGNETSVDCGGACPPCTNGQGCVTPGDCASGLCSAGTCQTCTLIPADNCAGDSEGSCICRSPDSGGSSVCVKGTSTGTSCGSSPCPVGSICINNVGIRDCFKPCGAP